MSIPIRKIPNRNETHGKRLGKYCDHCRKRYKTKKIYCPVCGYKLRTSIRNSISRKKRNQNKEYIE